MFKHAALQYRFVYSESGWLNILADRLHGYGRRGLLAIKPEDRPNWFGDRERRNPGLVQYEFMNKEYIRTLQKVEHWRTVDDEIPRWYEQWYKGLSEAERTLDFEP